MMSLEFLVEQLMQQNSSEISKEVDISADEHDYHYMFIKKSVILKKSLLSEEELLTFDSQDYFEIIISVEIDEDKNIVYDDHAKLYAYNPTKVTTGLGFNIHAPFRLDSHGSSILECAFNDYIFQLVAEAVSENLIYRLKSLDIRDIYKILYFERSDIETLGYFYGYLENALKGKEIFYAPKLERYISSIDLIIASDEDLDLFGEMLYEDTKLLISVEKQYEDWLSAAFDVKQLSGADIINNIESIVQRNLFDAKRLGEVYKYLLDCVDLDSEKIRDKKILPIFEKEHISFVSGFDIDVFYLYEDSSAFEFNEKLRQKINFLHEIVTFPDLLNRYESLGIKEYNQRNIFLKFKKIFLSTEDEDLKIEISKSILKQSKIDEENWEIVKEILMMPTSDGKWHLVFEKTIFYPNEVLIDMYGKSLFLDISTFKSYFKGSEHILFMEQVGIWFIPDFREEITNYHDVYFELCENWKKYRQLLDTKKIDKHFFDNLQKAKFIPIEKNFYMKDEVIFLSHGAQKYYKSIGNLYAFKNLNYEQNYDIVEILDFKHIDRDKASVFKTILDTNYTEAESHKILDFIIEIVKDDILIILRDLKFIALKNNEIIKVPFKEIVFIDNDLLYNDLPIKLKKSVPFFPLFEKKYVLYFKKYGKSLKKFLHTSILYHSKVEKSEKYSLYFSYINKMTKNDFGIDLKFENFSFYEVKDLQVKFLLDGVEDIHPRDYFIRGNHCYLNLAVCGNPKILAKMYQEIFEHKAHKKLPVLNYEIEKFLTEPQEFFDRKEIPKNLVKVLGDHNHIDLKKRVIDYFLETKDISYIESFEHKGYDFIERVDDKKFFCSVKENIDGQNIFKMSSEEIKKAENEGESYRVYLVNGFEDDIPIYKLVEDIGGLIKDNRILVSKSEYHLIIVDGSEYV